MSKEYEKSFLPFHAINEFMRDDYRKEIIKFTLSKIYDLPDTFIALLNTQTKKHVKVPGFRNSAKAPMTLLCKPVEQAFIKSPQLVAIMLASWAQLNYSLYENVYRLLQIRGWELIPIDADRTKLPGFSTDWPFEEDFELLCDSFRKEYPDFSVSQDDISLMAVWVSGRLPYHVPNTSITDD
jgi:hypothetical protein